MPEPDAKKNWEILLGVATLAGVVLAAGSVKESRGWICSQTADMFGTPLFCDYDARLTFRAFQYNNSADGVLRADACAPDRRVDTLLGEGSDIQIAAQPNTALCWVLNVTHPDFAGGVSLPVHLTVETPQPVYVDKMSGAISATPSTTDVTGTLTLETQLLTLRDEPPLYLDGGAVSIATRRLLLVQGDVRHWPTGRYRLTITSPLLSTPAPISASFELQAQ